jgi:hypothetical protein
MEIERTETLENEDLVKYYDKQGRIVEIAFLKSGSGCTIEYLTPPPKPDAITDERIVRWSTGQKYYTYKEEGKTKFMELKNDEKDWHY